MDIQALYNDPKFPGAFSGLNRFYKAVKTRDPTITLSDVKKALRATDTYTLHKPVKRPPLFRRVYTKGINYLYEIDLVDMSKFKSENDGYTFLICIIDTFSKRAWVYKLKSKSAKSIVAVMKPFLRRNKPAKMNFDQGTEFVNRSFLELLRKHKIKHFHVFSDRKACIVERFNRSLKSRMYRYFTSRGSHRYVDILQDIVRAYNTSYHRSIGMRPVDVTKRNEHIVRRNLYPPIVKEKRHSKIKFKVGDSVRITRKKTTFQRGFDQTYGYEVYKVSSIVNSYPPNYKLVDYKNNPILGSFYSNEIQLVDKSDNIWPIEKIVNRRKRRGNVEYLVKFQGYPDEANCWIPQQDLFNI